MKLELTEQEIGFILAVLKKQQWEVVNELIIKIMAQVQKEAKHGD